MVNTILKYIGSSIKASLTFLDNCYAPAFRIEHRGEVYYGDGVAKENVSISDSVGNGAYIRLLQPETARETKRISSCSKKFNYSAKCRLVYYSFTDDSKEWPIDKRKQAIKNVLNNLTFLGFKEMSSEISISINTVDDNFQKVFKAETNQEFSGDKWPFIIAIDFTINYSTSTDSECQDLCVNTDFEIIEPTPETNKTFCEKLESCTVISELQSKVIDLQQQIDNLPTSGLTCDDLPNCQTIQDITQSIQDIINSLPESYFSCSDLQDCSIIQDIQNTIESVHTELDNLEDAVSQNTTDLSNLSITVQALVNDVTSLIQSVTDLETNLNDHINDYNNPHEVTLEQVRSEDNSISGDINANNNTIINLKDAVNPQEPITKMQFDTYVSAVGGNRGSIDCSTNPNYPASNKGDRWEVTVAGKIGGPSGINVDIYDEIVCVTASASGNHATVGANFYIVQGNIERATETTSGYIQLATDSEVQTGTDNEKAVTSLKLANYLSLVIGSTTVDLGVVISKTNTPPGSPVIGDRYLVGTSPTGVWVGNSNKIATWNGASYTYVTPVNNNTVFITATLTTLRFNGTSWVAFQGKAILQNGNSLGVAMSIGTNDNFDVNFKRNGVTQWSINSTGALVRSVSTKSMNIGDSSMNLIDSSTAGTPGIVCTQTATNNRFAYFIRWGQAGGGNFAGTTVWSGDYLQISNGGSSSNPYPIMIRGSVIQNFIGHTGTNIATRLDNVGLRIGTMADIHTANTNLFDLKGKFHHDTNHNVVVGSAALATTATDGFFYIPTCAGVPTGVPTTKAGRIPMVYDSTNNKFYMYNGGWKSVTLA